MADVLLGVAPGTKGFNKLLVVKRLRPSLADDPSMVSMFLDEARLAARLSHTNLVHTFEIGEEAGGYFFIMEYLEGRPVSQIFDALNETGARLRPEIWAKIFAESLAGLHYAHELCDYDGVPLNVIHRDVSPQNIIVTFDGGVKLVDFGIAKASVNITETETGILKGKLAYMSPEQARAGTKVDRRADIFAAGIVLWECLAMKRLITGDAIAAARKLHGMKFAPPSSENPEVPPELDAIALRALERDPAARFQTAEQMRSALEGYLQTSRHYVQQGDIGGPIAKLFAEQRKDVRAQIRMHMASLRSERAAAAGADGEDRPTPSEHGANLEWPSEIASLPRIDVTESARSVRAVHKVADPWRGSNRWMWAVSAVVAGGIALIAGLAWVHPSSRGRQPPLAPHSSSAEAAPRTGASADLAPSPVHVDLRATPPEATITLDDAVLTNPFSGSFRRDAIVHRLQVTREGYTTEGRLLRFDGDDVQLAISLPTIPDAAPPEVKPRPAGVRSPRPQPSSSRPPLDKDPYE